MVEGQGGDEVVVAQRHRVATGTAGGAADQGDVDVAVLHGAGAGFGVHLDEAQLHVRAKRAVPAERARQDVSEG